MFSKQDVHTYYPPLPENTVKEKAERAQGLDARAGGTLVTRCLLGITRLYTGHLVYCVDDAPAVN